MLFENAKRAVAVAVVFCLSFAAQAAHAADPEVNCRGPKGNVGPRTTSFCLKNGGSIDASQNVLCRGPKGNTALSTAGWCSKNGGAVEGAAPATPPPAAAPAPSPTPAAPAPATPSAAPAHVTPPAAKVAAGGNGNAAAAAGIALGVAVLKAVASAPPPAPAPAAATTPTRATSNCSTLRCVGPALQVSRDASGNCYCANTARPSGPVSSGLGGQTPAGGMGMGMGGMGPQNFK